MRPVGVWNSIGRRKRVPLVEVSNEEVGEDMFGHVAAAQWAW